MMLPLNNSMQIKVITKNPIGKIVCVDLDSNSTEQPTEFNLENSWHKLLIPTPRINIVDIIMGDQSIKHILNAGAQIGEQYHIWIHGDLSVLMERVFNCINQDDLLRWTKLNRKYLLTESWNHTAPDFVPAHIKNFFARGQGPYWWHYDNTDMLPYRSTNIQLDTEKLHNALTDDLTYSDNKFYGSADCVSLKAHPQLPLVPITQLKNQYLKDFLKSAGYKSVLQIQRVKMQPNSYIDLHKDDFASSSGLPYIKGASQLYCVLQGDPNKFILKFDRAGIIDVRHPVYINNNAFVHSLYYNGTEPRTTLLIYGI